ncbi:MAG: hypothetical protein ACNA8R_10150 [Nitriliruptoraceae bacterium]
MMSNSIRSIVTSKAAITVAAVALLGGGAALAAPGEVLPFDDEDEVSTDPQEADEDADGAGQQGLDVADEARGRNRDVAVFCEDVPQAAFCRGPSEQEADDVPEDETTEDAPDEPEEPEEPEGNAWALGRQDEGQQGRVEAFCDARIAAAAVNGSNGVPPFCTAGDEGDPIPPNALGQRMAEPARGGELGEDEDDGAGPPPWAGRPDRTQDGSHAGSAPAARNQVERAGPREGTRGGPPAGVPGRGRG